MAKWVRVLGALGGVLLMAACSGGGGGRPGSPAASGHPQAAAASAAVVDIEPKDGTQGVAPAGALKVSVAGGKLTGVTVKDKDGKAVDGALAADGLSWLPAGRLAVNSAYQVSAQAVDAAGVATTANSSFSTLKPASTTHTRDNVTSGNKYGVGMIVSVTFDVPVKNTADVAKAITVEASDHSVVKGHWMGNQRLDLRPENFWKPGTTVQIHFRTTNVEVAPGVYGNCDPDETITIGRSKIAVADASTHQMLVKEDGFPDKTIPITAGRDDNPSWNGTMVVFEKDPVAHMDSATVPDIKGGAYTADEPHALKITDTGTYVHGNPLAPVAAGHSNISHGCIGLADTAAPGDDNSEAGRFYADAMIGDVVTIKNSIKKEPLLADNGLSGWIVPWANW